MTGINIHPEWYGNLSQKSSFEDFQMRLHTDNKSNCSRPCQTRLQLPPRRPWGKPSLFCFSVAQRGSEMDIMGTQLNETAGIFECDEFMVLSDAEVDLGREVVTTKIEMVNAGLSKDGTSANTATFIHAWAAVLKDGRYENHDFTVKVDPDTVLLPSRLRSSLEPFVDQTFYVPTCDLRDQFPDSHDYPMMYGALEVLSKNAVKAYATDGEKCKGELPWQDWGEDLYMGHCLDMCGVDQHVDLALVADSSCRDQLEGCVAPDHAAYHHFKTAESWLKCLNEARQ